MNSQIKSQGIKNIKASLQFVLDVLINFCYIDYMIIEFDEVVLLCMNVCFSP